MKTLAAHLRAEEFYMPRNAKGLNRPNRRKVERPPWDDETSELATALVMAAIALAIVLAAVHVRDWLGL